jgi:uncharacterized protein YegP (UPF0339 family)
MADFEVRKDKAGEWYWIFQAQNNKTIAKSSESYKNRTDCLHSIRLVKELAPSVLVWDMETQPISMVEKLP